MRPNPPISQPENFHHRGIRYTQPAEKTRGMSPLETSLSSFRLKASAAPIVVSVGPVKMVCEKYVEASSMSLENVYAKVNVKPREKRFSSFICSASYSESATLSRKRATLVNRGKARNNCCCAMVGCPRDDAVGIWP